MPITFYYASGSPPAWRVWLGLERKKLPYELKLLSFSEGDLRKPEYRAINPRGKVPAIVDDGFALYESSAILEYLDQRYPDSGDPLFPRDARGAATARRIIQEIDHYYAPASSRLLRLTLFNHKGGADPDDIERARVEIEGELAFLEDLFHDDHVAGPLSAADFALYTAVAITRRIEKKHPEHGIAEFIGPKMAAWAKRIEALPYFEKTLPPHWK